MSRVAFLSDPMLRLLVLAVVLALVLPATGAASDTVRAVSNGLIFLLFFVNGIRVGRTEVLRGLRNLRFLVPLFGWIFIAMAIAGVGLAALGGQVLPPVIALGFIYLGCMPSTVQSATSYTTIAGGSTALAVIGAALGSIAGVFISAPLFALLGGGAVGEIGNDAVVRIALLLVLPFVIGQVAQGWLKPLVDREKARAVWLDRIAIAMAVYVATSGAVENGAGGDLDMTAWLSLISLTALFLLFGHGGAWAVSGLIGYSREDRIAFVFGGAQKSIAVGAPLAGLIFPPAQAGFVLLPLLVYHFAQLVIAAPIAARFAAAPQPASG